MVPAVGASGTPRPRPSHLMAPAPRRTPLYDWHVELGARMVDFAGWEMPVYYVGINEEHRAVRARAGLFDVSHMGQIEVTGTGAEGLLKKALASDVTRLEEWQAQYSFLLNDKGGIIDDLIVYRLPDRWLLVVNAGNTDADFAHLKALKHRGATLTNLSDATAMIALQGPVALELLADVWPKKVPGPDTLKPFTAIERDVAGVPCLVARTGYTGEPGVEIMCAADRAGDLWDGILARREHGVVPSGLGARDTLRLEMGYPLHGHDIDAKTTPIEASLGRFVHLDGREFVGSVVLQKQVAKGVKRRLVGLRLVDRAIPREGYAILADGTPVGTITSGTLSPSIDRGIGLGYVPTELAEPGTVLQVDVRGRVRDADVVPLPFYKKES